jgi:hypothetical protein
MSLEEWLDTPPLPEEVRGDATNGFYLGIDRVKAKIRWMEKNFGVVVHQGSMRHNMLHDPVTKQTYSSATLEIEIWKDGALLRRVAGASTINIADYNHGAQGEYYANINKSLAICNAMLAFEQFGASLNREEVAKVNRPVVGDIQTSKKVKEAMSWLNK